MKPHYEVGQAHGEHRNFKPVEEALEILLPTTRSQLDQFVHEEYEAREQAQTIADQEAEKVILKHEELEQKWDEIQEQVKPELSSEYDDRLFILTIN